MLGFLKKFIDLIFYSNLWIGLCAAAMCWQTQFIFAKKTNVPIPPLFSNYLLGLVFFSTLFLYALHRIIGISKVHEFLEMERYAVIAKFKHHISIYAFIAAIGGLYCFWQISLVVKLSLLIPGVISLGYVIPFLSGKKRLRDLNHIKIFLIAIVWAWVTVMLPALESDLIKSGQIWMMAAERALFIFAITLPFDIRDLKVDSHSQVATIPAVIGIPKTKQLAGLVFFILIFLSASLWLIEFYSSCVFMGLMISYLSTWYFVGLSDKIQHDYFFTGLIDGTMILQLFFIGLMCFQYY